MAVTVRIASSICELLSLISCVNNWPTKISTARNEENSSHAPSRTCHCLHHEWIDPKPESFLFQETLKRLEQEKSPRDSFNQDFLKVQLVIFCIVAIIVMSKLWVKSSKNILFRKSIFFSSRIFGNLWPLTNYITHHLSPSKNPNLSVTFGLKSQIKEVHHRNT